MTTVPAAVERFRLETVACDLCGSTDLRVVMRKAGDLWTRTFDIVRCARCGLVFVNPRIAAEQIGSLYDDAYYRGEGFDRTIEYTRDDLDDPVNRASVERVTATLVDALGGLQGARVLDVGCGMGTLLRALQEAGANAEGVEFAAAARAHCVARGLTIAADSIDDPSLGEGSYDVVTAIEVIEHVTSPTEFLHRIRSLLRPGGIFYYTTGNWHLVRRAPGTAYIMPEGHLYYFTPTTMRAYLRKCGFDVVGGVLNRAWIGYRVMPPALRGAAARPVLQALSRLCGPLGQFPIGRRPE